MKIPDQITKLNYRNFVDLGYILQEGLISFETTSHEYFLSLSHLTPKFYNVLLQIDVSNTCTSLYRATFSWSLYFELIFGLVAVTHNQYLIYSFYCFHRPVLSSSETSIMPMSRERFPKNALFVFKWCSRELKILRM